MYPVAKASDPLWTRGAPGQGGTASCKERLSRGGGIYGLGPMSPNDPGQWGSFTTLYLEMLVGRVSFASTVPEFWFLSVRLELAGRPVPSPVQLGEASWARWLPSGPGFDGVA